MDAWQAVYVSALGSGQAVQDAQLSVFDWECGAGKAEVLDR